MTVNELIQKLQQVKTSLKDLPVVIFAPNGIAFEPKIKILLQRDESMYDKPKQIVITFD